MPFMYQTSRLGFGKPKGEGGEKDQGVVIAQTNKVSIDGTAELAPRTLLFESGRRTLTSVLLHMLEVNEAGPRPRA